MLQGFNSIGRGPSGMGGSGINDDSMNDSFWKCNNYCFIIRLWYLLLLIVHNILIKLLSNSQVYDN